MSPRSVRRTRNEAGVTLVIFALALTAIFIMVAIIIDLGAQRQGRRVDRSASDAAVSAAAIELGSSSSPNAACVAAMSTLGHNLGVTIAASTPCSTGFGATGCVAATPRSATAVVGAFTITFTNPVIDSSPLMSAEAGGSDPAQPVNATHDGTDPCKRVGLQVVRSERTFFGGITGTSRLATDIHSVARSTLIPHYGHTIPALVALDPHGCDVIDANTGIIRARPATGQTGPGIIRTDTDATNCAAGGNFIQNVQNTGSGLIEADFSPDGTTVQAGGGNLENFVDYLANGGVFRPGALPGPTKGYYGNKVTASGPLTRNPMDLFYHCANATPACQSPSPTVDIYNTQISPLLSGAPPVGYTTISGPACSTAAVYIGNFYVNCPNYSAASSFNGAGTVIFEGGVSVNNLSFNATCTLNVLCATDKLVIIRGNGGQPDLSLQANAHLIAPQTTIFQARGDLTMQGGPVLDWSAPVQAATGTQFLLYWTESANTINIQGNPVINSTGIFFIPNSLIDIVGNAVVDANNVQFWAKDVRLQGNGSFFLRPDPTESRRPPDVGSVLIR